MKKILLIAIILLGLPATALAHDVHLSDHSSFGVEGDALVISREHRRGDDEVTVSRDGELTINGERIKVSDAERKDLKKLYREAAKLEKMAEEIGEEAERIAKASKKFATVQVAAALRALGDGDDEDLEEELEAEMEKVETRFEAEMEEIEHFAEKIENQADEVVDLAEDLQDRIPELGELRWFLDD